MIIFAFSTKTTKILPRIICRHYRHVAPIIIDTNNQMVMYQFVRYKKIVPIPVNKHGLRLLKQHGWLFIQTNKKPILDNINNSISCVDLAKRISNIYAPYIQTPDALYKMIAYK